MSGLQSSVSPKGQVTIPLEMRRLLRLKAKDKVTFRLEGGGVLILPLAAALEASYQAVPALDPPRTPDEVREIAREEQAQEAAREGL